MRPIKTFLSALTFKTKSVLAIITSVSIILFYQNCAKTEFGRVLEESQSIAGKNEICSVDSINSSLIKMNTTGFQSSGSLSTEMRAGALRIFVLRGHRGQPDDLEAREGAHRGEQGRELRG